MSDNIWETLQYNGDTYENFEISNDGQLRNVKTGTVYKQHINKEGYNQVCVSLGGRNKKKVFKIHKAVAETFIDNPKNKSDVNHKDGNKQNNTNSNLEWMTSKENMEHASQNGLLKPLCGVNSPNSKLTAEDIVYIREHYIARDPVYGSRALGRKFDVNHSSILNIINGVSYVNV